jgi:hypothetical protein
MNRDGVRRFVERRDDPSVPQVLGRFELPPSAADEVRELLGATNRARDRHTAPFIQGRGPTSTAAGGRGGSENRSTEAGLPGLPGLPGQNRTPSLRLGEGGRARGRIGKAQGPEALEGGDRE